MYCTRKHLLFDKSYIIYLNQDNVSIGESTKNVKYVIPLNLKTIIDWKVDEENQYQIEAFAIQWGREWKYFYASFNVCQKLKQHLDGRVCYKNMDIFYNCLEKIESKAMSAVRTIQPLQGGQVLVCKEIQKQKRFADFLFQNEIETLKLLQHRNIINLVEAFENTYNYQIILEYAKGGSLKQCLKYCKLKIEETNIIITQLLEAVVYLHKQGFVHRDLKPENLLFSELGKFSQLKIIDFGISTQISKLESEREMKFGTPGYMAPEILIQSQKNKISEKIDIFSCGAILFYMLTGQSMIHGITQKELTNNNKLFQFTSELGQQIAQPKYKELVSRMVAKDPNNRVSAQEALSILRSFNAPLSMSTSLQCYQDPIQILPDFNKLIVKA